MLRWCSRSGCRWPHDAVGPRIPTATAGPVPAQWAPRPRPRTATAVRSASSSKEPAPVVDEEQAEAAARSGWDPEGLFSRPTTTTTSTSTGSEAQAISWLDRQQQRRRQQQQQQQQQGDAAQASTSAAAPPPAVAAPARPAPSAASPAASSAAPPPPPAAAAAAAAAAAPAPPSYSRADLDAALQLLGARHMAVAADTPGLSLLHADPPVVLVEGFMSPGRCDEWMEAAEESGCLAASKVGAGNAAGYGPSAALTSRRTSSSALLEPALLARAPRLATLMADLHRAAYRLMDAGDGSSWQAVGRLPGPGQYGFESPQVARYHPGQYFLSHEDAFPTPIAATNRFQRHATLLVYLNDVPAGGCTVFDTLGPLAVQPAKGAALLFFPSYADGLPDGRTLHTATPPQACTKWVVQQWIVRGWQPHHHTPAPTTTTAAAAAPAAAGGTSSAGSVSRLPAVMKVSVGPGGSAAPSTTAPVSDGKTAAKAGKKKQKGGGSSKRGFGG